MTTTTEALTAHDWRASAVPLNVLSTDVPTLQAAIGDQAAQIVLLRQERDQLREMVKRVAVFAETECRTVTGDLIMAAMLGDS